MSYYQGDYYQGDYYQGDPFLGALIGTVGTWLGRKLLKRGASKALVASTGAGALIGGAGGVATGAVGGALVQQGAGALWRKFVSPRPTLFVPPPRGGQMGPGEFSGGTIAAGGGVRVSVRIPPEQDDHADGSRPGNDLYSKPIDERRESARLAPLVAACRRFRQARCAGPEDGQRDR